MIHIPQTRAFAEFIRKKNIQYSIFNKTNLKKHYWPYFKGPIHLFGKLQGKLNSLLASP